MVQLATVEAHGQVLDDIVALAISDIAGAYRSISGADPLTVRDILLAGVPDILDPYAAAIGDVSATFYEQVREQSGVTVPYTAAPVDLPERGRVEKLVRWGISPLFDQAATTTALLLLSGGAQRILLGQSRDTIAGNGQRDRVQVGYQRVPKPGCCAFCGMLASRGATYDSAASAGDVVGRGVPIPRVKKSGGQAKGIRSRGARAIGEKYHDFCRCKAVPVFNNNWVEMQAGADKYLDAYAEARNKVSDARKADGYQGYGDQATSQKMILAEMRQALGVS